MTKSNERVWYKVLDNDELGDGRLVYDAELV